MNGQDEKSEKFLLRIAGEMLIGIPRTPFPLLPQKSKDLLRALEISNGNYLDCDGLNENDPHIWPQYLNAWSLRSGAI